MNGDVFRLSLKTRFPIYRNSEYIFYNVLKELKQSSKQVFFLKNSKYGKPLLTYCEPFGIFVEHRTYLYSLRIKSLQHFKNIFLVFSYVTVLFVGAHNSCGLTMILISATNSPSLIYLVNHLLIMWQRKKSKENDVKFK